MSRVTGDPESEPEKLALYCTTCTLTSLLGPSFLAFSRWRPFKNQKWINHTSSTIFHFGPCSLYFITLDLDVSTKSRSGPRHLKVLNGGPISTNTVFHFFSCFSFFLNQIPMHVIISTKKNHTKLKKKSFNSKCGLELNLVVAKDHRGIF